MKEELLVGKNEQPTGSLYLSAKESGFNYVAKILVVNDTTILPSNEANEKKYVIFLFMLFRKSHVVDMFG